MTTLDQRIAIARRALRELQDEFPYGSERFQRAQRMRIELDALAAEVRGDVERVLKEIAGDLVDGLTK